MTFLPIHEVMERVIPEGQEMEACELSDDREGFGLRLRDWAGRVGIGSEMLSSTASIALWGDSAPCTKRGSVYLLTWTLVSGQCRHRC